jgi:hypothetical protein
MLGMSALIVSIVGTVIAAINHKKIRSNCCGRKVEMSIDIQDTTNSPSVRPINPHPPISQPPPPPILSEVRVPPN